MISGRLPACAMKYETFFPPRVIINQVVVKILANEVPFYQYKRDPQIMVALVVKREIPLRPEPDTAMGPNGIDDAMWELLVKCWNYTPQDRPSSAVLLDSIKAFELRDDRLASVAKVATGPALRSNISLDFARIEIFLVSNNLVPFGFGVLPILDPVNLENFRTTVVQNRCDWESNHTYG